jgi:hypothetical protein
MACAETADERRKAEARSMVAELRSGAQDTDFFEARF